MKTSPSLSDEAHNANEVSITKGGLHSESSARHEPPLPLQAKSNNSRHSSKLFLMSKSIFSGKWAANSETQCLIVLQILKLQHSDAAEVHQYNKHQEESKSIL